MPATINRPLDNSEVELFDCTIRDGSYAVDFQFDENFVLELLSGLDSTPIRQIEIGHGIGIDAETAGAPPCNIDLDRWCAIARETVRTKRWGMFAQPGFTRLETLSRLAGAGMDFVRVGIEPAAVPASLDYLRRAVEICGNVYLNLMKTSATPVDEVRGLLGGVSPELAGIYVVDSFGAMLPGDVTAYVHTLRESTDTVGFHGHDNLGLANVNSITALESGASIADGTLNGIGRGAGNAQLESLAGILALIGGDQFDYQRMSALAEFCRTNTAVAPEDRNMQVLGGVIGMHSGHFPLIQKLAGECAVPAARLMELAADRTAHAAGPADIEAAAASLRSRSRPAEKLAV